MGEFDFRTPEWILGQPYIRDVETGDEGFSDCPASESPNLDTYIPVQYGDRCCLINGLSFGIRSPITVRQLIMQIHRYLHSHVSPRETDACISVITEFYKDTQADLLAALKNTTLRYIDLLGHERKFYGKLTRDSEGVWFLTLKP